MYSATRGGDFEASNEALRQICGAYRLVCERWWEFRGSIRRAGGWTWYLLPDTWYF